MKKALFVMALATLATAGTALADHDIGCGWGTMLWQGQEGVPQKVMGATTNASFGMQTFAISSQTAGCRRNGVIKVEAATRMYAAANVDRLARDMAMGEGESLGTLAHLLGIPDADQPRFFQLTKSHFAEIYSSDDITAAEMLTNLNDVLATDPQLAKYSRS
jgi:cyclopropane fatty-acyl-phospholipid synthase-like methyltransferase